MANKIDLQHLINKINYYCNKYEFKMYRKKIKQDNI